MEKETGRGVHCGVFCARRTDTNETEGKCLQNCHQTSLDLSYVVQNGQQRAGGQEARD